MELTGDYKDYYAVLGLSPDADQREIGRAYRRLIKAIHPDARGGEKDPAAGWRVAELVEAWRVLGDRARRAAYDRVRQAKLSQGFAPSERFDREQAPPVVTVVAEEAPHLVVRPAAWVVEPWECESAPRSLALHLSVANEGGGKLVGSVEAPPWIVVEPRALGPMAREDQPQRVLVQVDCQEWRRAGYPESPVWVSAHQGDARRVRLLLGNTRRLAPPNQGSNAASWIASPAVFCLGVGPALILLLGLPAPLLALFLAGALALPALLDRLMQWEVRAAGPGEEALGWEMGPLGDDARLLVAAGLWAFLGWVLGTAGSTRAPWMPGQLSPWLGAMAAGWCCLTVSTRDPRVKAMERLLGPMWGWFRPVGAGATVASWALLAGVAAAAALGWTTESAFQVGASAGWMLGVGLLFARSSAAPARWRPRLHGLLMDIIPLVSAGAGFASGLLLATGSYSNRWGLAALQPFAGTTSRLVELPAAGLAAALGGIAVGLGLLAGFGAGVLAVLPSVKPALASRGSGAAQWAVMDRARALVEGALESYARLNGENRLWGDCGRRLALASALSKCPPSMLIVGAVSSLLLVYSTAHLLLAIVAFLGVVAG